MNVGGITYLDCVLLVLSDHLYNKEEYIRDFDEYLKLVK